MLGESLSSTSDTSPSCAICTKPAIYTCPGCAARTCSAACSSSHKTRTECTGSRNRAAYVPLNDYGLGTLMNDYTYLEDVGRKVGEWGQSIVRERLVDVSAANVRGGRGRGRGEMRGRGWAPGQHRSKAASKREVLKRNLDLWDIEVDLLPTGMARSQQNRSIWDFKNKKPLLTVEFNIHASQLPLAGQAKAPTWTLLTHQNSLEERLLGLFQRHVKSRGSRKGEQSLAEWVTSMALPTPEDPEGFSAPEMFLAAASHDTPSQRPDTLCFYALDCSQPLSAALRHSSFVEYPTIHVYSPGEFKGTVVDRQGAVTRVVEDDRPAKRRKIDKKKSAVAMKGLVGGYGSDEEPSGDEDALAALGEYPASDDEADGLDEDTVAADPQSMEEAVYRPPSVGAYTSEATVDTMNDGGEGSSEEYEDEEADRQLIAELERRMADDAQAPSVGSS